jgi:hypothetical protein
MKLDFSGFDHVHLSGDNATRSPRHAALLVLAGISPLHPRALPDAPITALASAFNYRFQVQQNF